jgi:hypothetical protein
MKQWILLWGTTAIVGLTVLAEGQWQVQPQLDTRTGPIYPTNPSYNFHSSSNYDPFQFNWGSGRFDYVPIPYDNATGGGAEPAPPPVPYGVWAAQQSPWNTGSSPAANFGPPGAIPPGNPPAPKPDDTELWSGPTTRPDTGAPAKIVKFEGRVVAIKAMSLAGEATPHLLLRLRSDSGAMGTVDAGQRLAIPDGAFDAKTKGEVTATGQLGMIDGHLILFADQIGFGSQTVDIERRGKEAGK